MYVKFKIMSWEEVQVPQDSEKEILSLIKNGKIHSRAQLNQHLGINNPGQSPVELRPIISPDLINGASTIEAYDDQHIMIHCNGLS